MMKHEFLNQLDAQLSQLPPHERQKSQSYYAEMIDDRMEEGMTEEEAVAALGDVVELARQVLMETPLQTLIKSKMRTNKRWETWEIVLFILGFPLWFPLLIAFFAVVFCIYVAVWSVIVSLFAVAVCLAIVGMAMVAACFVAIFTGTPAWAVLLGAGFALMGVGILSFIGMCWFSKVLVKGTGVMGKWIKSLFIRKEKEDENSR